jgi:hypothetical protein
MSREFKNGVWITTRDPKTPDSERHVERDDPLFPSLAPLFAGEQTQVDFAAIAVKHETKPADVFMDLNDNYGYICIGTGENPAKGEKLTPEQVAQRKQKIKEALEAAHIPYIPIQGKYFGVVEDSFFIPFNDKAIGLAAVLQGETVKEVIRIADSENQDSILICQGGRCCYVYTSGPQKGSVVTGHTTIVYPSAEQFPADCYSVFKDANDVGTLAFSCDLNFDKIFPSIAQFAAEESGARLEYYKHFVTAPVATSVSGEAKQKTIYLTRGVSGYNEYAIEIKERFEKEGKKVAIFGTDANLAKINDELKDENSDLFKFAIGIKREELWRKVIRPEFIKRNIEIYQSLLKSDCDVIIYADMNKLALPEFMMPYIGPALERGDDISCLVKNSFVFDPARSGYAEELRKLTLSLPRHLDDCKKPEGQIYGKTVKIGDKVVRQEHDLTPDEIWKLSLEQKSFSALTSGLVGTVLAATKQPEGGEVVPVLTASHIVQ